MSIQEDKAANLGRVFEIVGVIVRVRFVIASKFCVKVQAVIGATFFFF
jgi:hypothetical protein